MNYQRISLQATRPTCTYTSRVKPRTNPRVNDDSAAVRASFISYRKRVFNAIVILPYNVNAAQEKQWHMFVYAMQQGKFDLRNVKAKSWILAQEIVKVREEERTSAPKYDKPLQSKVDATLKCSERIDTIINFLDYSESICLDLMESGLALSRFAAAPNAVLKEKHDNKAASDTATGAPVATQSRTVVGPAPPELSSAGAGPTPIGPVILDHQPHRREILLPTNPPAVHHRDRPSNPTTSGSTAMRGDGRDRELTTDH